MKFSWSSREDMRFFSVLLCTHAWPFYDAQTPLHTILSAHDSMLLARHPTTCATAHTIV